MTGGDTFYKKIRQYAVTNHAYSGKEGSIQWFSLWSGTLHYGRCDANGKVIEYVAPFLRDGEGVLLTAEKEGTLDLDFDSIVSNFEPHRTGIRELLEFFK